MSRHLVSSSSTPAVGHCRPTPAVSTLTGSWMDLPAALPACTARSRAGRGSRQLKVPHSATAPAGDRPRCCRLAHRCCCGSAIAAACSASYAAMAAYIPVPCMVLTTTLLSAAGGRGGRCPLAAATAAEGGAGRPRHVGGSLNDTYMQHRLLISLPSSQKGLLRPGRKRDTGQVVQPGRDAIIATMLNRCTIREKPSSTNPAAPCCGCPQRGPFRSPSQRIGLKTVTTRNRKSCEGICSHAGTVESCGGTGRLASGSSLNQQQHCRITRSRR